MQSNISYSFYIITVLLFGSFCRLTHCDNKTEQSTLNLGILIPWTQEWDLGPTMGSGAVLGVEEVKRRGLLPGYDIEWIWRDTYCKPRQGLAIAVDMWSHFHGELAAFIGLSFLFSSNRYMCTTFVGFLFLTNIFVLPFHTTDIKLN